MTNFWQHWCVLPCEHEQHTNDHGTGAFTENFIRCQVFFKAGSSTAGPHVCTILRPGAKTVDSTFSQIVIKGSKSCIHTYALDKQINKLNVTRIGITFEVDLQLFAFHPVLS